MLTLGRQYIQYVFWPNAVYIEYNYAIKQQIIDAAYFPSQKMVSNTHAHAPAHTHTRAHIL